MAELNRRRLLRSAVGTAAALSGRHALAQAARPEPPKAGALPPVTRILAQYARTAPSSPIPAGVRKEATRTLLNWVGVAVGGSTQDAPGRAAAALLPFSGPAQAGLFGRTERCDILTAAVVNGISSHVMDFDDTDPRTFIHPAGPVLAALTAYAEASKLSGTDFMNAFVIGCEVECRIGLAVLPEHYAIGWHITGTAGVFGAAAAMGRVLGLTERQMVHALGIAAAQPVGLKVEFGSDTKSLHPGQAAHVGMVSAYLAQRGFTASEVALEGTDGWAQVMSTRHDWSKVTEGLGERYELTFNTYKAFAAGAFGQPAIDGALQFRMQDQVRADQVASIALKVNDQVLKLMGKTEPGMGLEGKFSIYHNVAAALVLGTGGEHAFSDAAVRNPEVVALRRKVTAVTDPAIAGDQVDMTVTLNDGRVLHRFVEHAVGSQQNPMTDAQLETKFAELCDGVLPPARARRLVDACWGAWALEDAGEILRLGAAAG